MKRIIISTIICLIASNGFAQNSFTGSLKAILSKTTDLYKKYQLLDQINSEYYKAGTSEGSLIIAFEMVCIATDLKNDSLIARAYNALGAYYELIKGDYNAGPEYLFKGISYALKEKNTYGLPSLYSDIAVGYWLLGNTDQELLFLRKAEAALPDKTHPGYDYLLMQIQVSTAFYYVVIHNPDKALPFIKAAGLINSNLKYDVWTSFIQITYGDCYLQKGDIAMAHASFLIALDLDKKMQVPWSRYIFITRYINFLIANKDYEAAIEQSNELMKISGESNNDYFRLAAFGYLKEIYDQHHKTDSAYQYAKKELKLKDTVFNSQIFNRVQALNFSEEMRLKEEAEQAKQKIKTITVLIGFSIILLIALILYHNSRQRKKANFVLQKTLSDLKSTQQQLIQSEKMASLGELTAGIAHEIQNPLNFVKNFSEVNKGLLTELKAERLKQNTERNEQAENEIIDDVIANEGKINHHCKRADAIVKGMLQHSQSGKGVKELTDINALCDEYLKLSYHGLRAKDKNFNADLKTDFDNSINKINIVPQEIARVLINLINNTFYAVNERKKIVNENYHPTVSILTKKINNNVEMKVSDNGNGIPSTIINKIFQPIFSTKATGQGTGLGLSLSYDIVKAHGGEIKVKTKEGEGTEFIIKLPAN